MPLYRALLALSLWTAFLFRRVAAHLAGRPQPRAETERWVLDRPHSDGAPRLWFHAASNGELTSARALMRLLLARDPALRLLVTCNSTTGRALIESWGEPRIEGRFAPHDLAGPIGRLLDLWRPLALIVVENELWPERLLRCARRGIPVLVVGARMSQKSAATWGLAPRLARRVLGAVSYLAAQDAASEARLRALGLPGDRIGPVLNLKSAVRAAAGAPLPFPRERTLLAASTHEGEEAIVLAAFQRARAGIPGLHLVIAPRHPRRRDEIEAAIRTSGLAFGTRSRGDEPDAGQPVYLADTMGEMDRWYAGAGMTFVGGSLVDRGGHTPFEPASHLSAILHGPHVANSAPAYGALGAAGAAVEVRDADTLAAAILALADPAAQARLAQAAAGALRPLGDGPGLAAFLAALAALSGRRGLANDSPAPEEPHVHPARA